MSNEEIKSTAKKDYVFKTRNLNFWYSRKTKQALFDINLDIERNKTTALIGPSGCGKSTYIKLLNRIHDLDPDCSYDGQITFNGINLKDKKAISDIDLRQRVGMIFQQPTIFPLSIFDNIAVGLRNIGIRDKKELEQRVIEALKKAAIYEEVKDKLNVSASQLSGGQKQRLCIARTIALKPEVLLMDEPTSALDPIATQKIENLINELHGDYTIVIVTHSMAQAQRISDQTVFFLDGKIIEDSPTRAMFTKPLKKQTKDYIMGKIG